MRNNVALLAFAYAALSFAHGACASDSASASGGCKTGMECIAHRGYWNAEIPENTVEAIKCAYEYGADWVETDFNLMPDGKMLCFHDPKTRDRTIKPPFHVPTLEEVLAVVPKDRHIQCEIKTYGDEYAAGFSFRVYGVNSSTTLAHAAESGPAFAMRIDAWPADCREGR